MDSGLISTVLNIVFLVVTAALGILLALCIYIYVRYGRTRSITIASSIVAAVIFLIGTAAAHSALQAVISLYV